MVHPCAKPEPNRRHTSYNNPLLRNETCCTAKINKVRPLSEGFINERRKENGKVAVKALKSDGMSEEMFLEEALNMYRSNKVVDLFVVCELDEPKSIKY